MALIVPPGSAAERGAYNSAPSQPRAAMVSGISDELSLANSRAAKDIESSAHALADQLLKRGQQIEEENLTRRIMEAKIEYGESLNKMLVDPDSGVLNRQGGDAIGSTKEFGDRAAALINERLDGWSGRAKDTFEMSMRGVRADMVRAVATHEAKQRDVHADVLRDRAFEGLKSTAVTLGSQPDLGRVLQKVDLELDMIMPNVRGDADTKALWRDEARRSVLGLMLASRIKANPDTSLDLVNSVRSGDGPVKPTDLHEQDLAQMETLAREAYRGQVFSQAQGLVAQGGEAAGMKFLQDNPVLTADEKRQGANIIKAEFSYQEAKRNRAEKDAMDKATDMVIRGNIGGRVFTPKDMLDANVPPRAIPDLMRVQEGLTGGGRKNDVSVFVQARGLVDAGSISNPAALTSYAVLGGRVVPAAGLSENDRKRATPLIAHLDDAHVEKLLGRLDQSAGGDEKGKASRANARGNFEALVKGQGMKEGSNEYAWALMAWDDAADQLKDALGKQPTSADFSKLSNDLFVDRVIGSGLFGAKSQPAWKVRATMLGASTGLNLDVPAEARTKIEQELRGKGLTATDEQVRQIYFDPRNQGRF